MHTAYPELFAVLGGSVPDFRGLFLRGVGGNSTGLGQAQGDAIRNITGHMREWKGRENTIESSGALYTMDDGTSETNGHTGWHGKNSNYTYFDASRVVPTAEENRPVNKAVRYLIRALP